jgi:hypothetical protein
MSPIELVGNSEVVSHQLKTGKHRKGLPPAAKLLPSSFDLERHVRPKQTNVEFHEKVYLPEDQRNIHTLSPGECKLHWRESLDRRVEQDCPRIQICQVSRQLHSNRLATPIRAEPNSDVIGKHIEHRTAVNQTGDYFTFPLMRESERNVGKCTGIAL